MVYEEGADYCSFSPDVILGVRISKCCHNHDRQYRNEVKRRKSRLGADMALRDEIKAEFNKKNKDLIGLLVSYIYYLGVRLFCGKFWKN